MSDSASSHAHPRHPQHFWLWVMCLTGVDYFSTLGYQPAIAYRSAGLLAPFATVVLVCITLFGALPLYRYVASRSFSGQGSLGMLARLVSGWPGKILVLTLLGFAATDFVITKTLSAADASQHLLHNPVLKGQLPDSWKEGTLPQVLVTMFFLMLLGSVFMRGFREVIGLAVGIVGLFLVLNLVVVGSGLLFLIDHPERIQAWFHNVRVGNWYLHDTPIRGTGLFTTIVVCLLLFPKLALGLSGFETGIAVMPLVKGEEGDTAEQPTGRIRNTRKLLLTAACIMSVMLMSSSMVVTILIPPGDITPVSATGEPPVDEAGKPIKNPEKWPSPPAAGRALAYLAHGESPDGRKICGLFGSSFGTLYDFSTILILWFAGASAMAGLLNIVPQYLPKYGMAPEWASAIKPLVLMFTSINLLVTLIFRANVEAQGAAYATGVLVLMFSDGLSSVIDIFRNRKGSRWQRLHKGYIIITFVLLYTLVDNIIEKSAGIKIAACFILTILVLSLTSRILRSRELRFKGFVIPDVTSKLLWDAIRHLEASILVPHRPGQRSLEEKEAIVRKEHRIPPELMITFIEVEKSDPSEFIQQPTLRITQQEGKYVMKISNAASISHTLAAVALEMSKVGDRPPEIHFGWTEESPMSGTLGFLLFGEGNVPWMVRELLRRAEPDTTKRPLIFIAGQ
ncbi:MAG: amino acid transporter [Zavarzinella sp.]